VWLCDGESSSDDVMEYSDSVMQQVSEAVMQWVRERERERIKF
jgi:hypothetical protein